MRGVTTQIADKIKVDSLFLQRVAKQIYNLNHVNL